jgi:hypothetical protein
MTQQPPTEIPLGFDTREEYLAFLAEGHEPITEERVRRELERRGWPTDQASIDCAISDQDFARECGWLE